MSETREFLRKFAIVTKIDLLLEAPGSGIECLGGFPDDNPVMKNEALRTSLREGAAASDFAFLLKDTYEVFFSAIRTPEFTCYIGPMSTLRQDKPTERRFYRSYGINPADVRPLRFFTLQEVLYIVELIDERLTGRAYAETQLLFLNHLAKIDPKATGREQILFSIQEDDINEDDETRRHTYREEQRLMEAVREGRVQDALSLSRAMDSDSGRLSNQDLTHWRNLAIIGIALTTRAAIEGGLSPQDAYRISGYYIQKCDAMTSATQLLGVRDYAIREIATLVQEKLAKKRSSTYTETAKTYISRHYREKLRLEDIADVLGISPSYLSRLFKKDTGVQLSEYIIQVRVSRAANLLRYSDRTLAEIAEYVGFPTQSYFGKIFRQQMSMTPRAYREKFRAAEWQDAQK